MKVLFLGYAVNRETASQLYGASVAGNKMQVNVLEQLAKYSDMDLRCITIYPVAAYPKGKLLIKREKICLFDSFYSLKIGFLNLPILKQVCETFSTYFEGKRLIKKYKIKTIFTFNMFPEVGLPAKWLKKKYGCNIVTLLADLPIDDTVGRKGISKVLRRIFDHLTWKGITLCDKIITLNKYAIQLFSPDKPYIVMEGGLDSRDINEIPVKTSTKKNLVYSGALVEYSGIINLIKAMQYVEDKEAILNIYGSGQITEYVVQCAEKMDNVRYWGKIDNNSMKRIQSEAYLLINPRPVDNLISKVTFPSKIFEYMVSGTPVLTTRLNGFTEEYYDKMFFVKNNEPMELAGKINEIMGLPSSDLRKKALLAREFVLENKTWEKQCKKIYEFIKKEV
jgi:glycosyltransferase involved in cell wall biosynthesis